MATALVWSALLLAACGAPTEPQDNTSSLADAPAAASPAAGDEAVPVYEASRSLYSVPDEAILVWDTAGTHPYWAWTEPVDKMQELDPAKLTILTQPTVVVPPPGATGQGGGGGSAIADWSDGDAAVEAGEVEMLTGTALYTAYAGNMEEHPIDWYSPRYTGTFSQNADEAPPPGWSSYQYGSTSQRRVVLWNYTGLTATLQVQHKHASTSSYHDLCYANFSSCYYCYDCVYTQALRARLYVSIDTDAFDIVFYTSCSASCY